MRGPAGPNRRQGRDLAGTVASDAVAGPEVRWRARPPAPPGAVRDLMAQLKVPPLLASVLHARGLTADEAGRLLSAPLEPLDLATLEAAAARLWEAIEAGERILVHGDYDADGITGTALLTRGLRTLGARVEPFLPNRLTHGYGVSTDLVERHAARCDLFVTVDCGVTNVREVASLRGAGVDVIVTDHHTPGDVLPDALVVHPRLDANAEPGRPEPTGAGVAFHLLWALHRRLGLEAPMQFADLAAIGTVADVAPLLGPNRALVREGLARLPSSAWPGVRAMIQTARLDGDVTARDVAFVLAPRLNAAGRLGEPETGLELLLADATPRAQQLATYLDARNDERKRIQDEMFEQAVARVDPHEPAIIIADDDWHPGIMGVVASKLVERFHRPVFIIAGTQGSVRSTPGISAVRALRAVADDLLRFGGHEAAAGFTIDPARRGSFEQRIKAHVASYPTPTPEVVADALLAPDQVDSDLWRSLAQLEPYGEGHATPTFALCDVLSAARAVGRESRHLQLRVGDVKGVAWNQGALAGRLQPGAQVQAAVTLRENVWKDRRTLEFVADAVRPGAALPVHGPNGAPRTASRHVRRGPPPTPDGGMVLRQLPLGEEPLRAHEPLADHLARGTPIWFDLDEAAQQHIAHAARGYPNVPDVRRAFMARRAGTPSPLPPEAEALAEQVLRELDLLDHTGAPRPSARGEPYESPALLEGLLQRYRLETFLNAYRHLDEEGFAATTLALYGGDAD